MKRLLILALAAAMVGCSSTSNLGSLGSLVQNPWVLQSLGGVSDLTSMFGGKLPSLNFSKDGKVSGNDGCNNLTGSMATDMLISGKLDFSKLASTKMACPDSKGSDAFNEMLGKATNFNINDNVLSLLDQDGSSLASFVPKKD